MYECENCIIYRREGVCLNIAVYRMVHFFVVFILRIVENIISLYGNHVFYKTIFL